MTQEKIREKKPLNQYNSLYIHAFQHSQSYQACCVPIESAVLFIQWLKRLIRFQKNIFFCIYHFSKKIEKYLLQEAYKIEIIQCALSGLLSVDVVKWPQEEIFWESQPRDKCLLKAALMFLAFQHKASFYKTAKVQIAKKNQAKKKDRQTLKPKPEIYNHSTTFLFCSKELTLKFTEAFAQNVLLT